MLGKIWNWLNGNDATPKNMQQQQSNHVLATSNDDEYTKLLKKYYRKFGDLLFELDNLLSKLAREIKESTGDKKTLQKIRFDLKRISSENSELVIRNGITGVWIHNSLQIAMPYDDVADCEELDGIEIDRNNYFQTNFDNIAICGNVIYYMEYPIFYHDEYGENHLYKSFSVDVSNYTKKDIDNDYPISWVSCKCYDICDETKRINSKNPPSLLAELYRIMRVCNSICKCAYNNKELRKLTSEHTSSLNVRLNPYGITTKMTETGWMFFYEDTPITLEEAIRRIPDDDLLRIPEGIIKKWVCCDCWCIYEGDTPPEKCSSCGCPGTKFVEEENFVGEENSESPQSQPKASTPTPAQQAPTPPSKAPSKPNLSIEEELLNYLKAQPICWEFPLTTQDKALNQFCEALVFSKDVTSVGSDKAIKNLELTIQKKRARNPQLADHNAAMEGNILAILYEYSYLMHIFHALDDMKFDTTKVDISKLWLLIQQDCNARINNLDEEKRKNPTIQIVLNKYSYDTQINRLKVLNDATGREMDYIIAFIMAYSLLTIISLLLGNPKLLQPLKPYPADDIAGMMNALINASVGLRFTAYLR